MPYSNKARNKQGYMERSQKFVEDMDDDLTHWYNNMKHLHTS